MKFFSFVDPLVARWMAKHGINFLRYSVGLMLTSLITFQEFSSALRTFIRTGFKNINPKYSDG